MDTPRFRTSGSYCPDIKIVDVIHSVDEAWDQIASTAEVASRDRPSRGHVAGSVRDRLLALGYAESKILLVRNGVDLERFQPTPAHTPDSAKNILFAARLGSREAAAAGRRYRQGACDAPAAARLSIHRRRRRAGKRDASSGESARLGLNAVFDFRGQVDDLAPLYAAADVVILPSRSEGVPLVVLEALASARPMVASNVGSIPEVLDSSCGILIDNPDPAEFARAINSLLDQPELREKMGAAGRRKMEASHDIRKTREAFAQLFDQGSSVSVSSTSRSTAME